MMNSISVSFFAILLHFCFGATDSNSSTVGFNDDSQTHPFVNLWSVLDTEVQINRNITLQLKQKLAVMWQGYISLEEKVRVLSNELLQLQKMYTSLGVAEPILVDSDVGCSSPFTPLYDFCLWVSKANDATWFIAKGNCEMRGGQLLSVSIAIDEKTEIDVMKAASFGEFWVGAHVGILSPSVTPSEAMDKDFQCHYVRNAADTITVNKASCDELHSFICIKTIGYNIP